MVEIHSTIVLSTPIIPKQRLYAGKPVMTREERLAKKRAYYLANREKALATIRAWFASHQEEVKDYRQRTAAERNRKNHAWREANPERVREYNATYSATHRESERQRARRRYQENPEPFYAKNARRRARKLNAPMNDLTASQWNEIKAAYNFCCAYCGRKMKRLTQDHITPLTKGGSNTASNIVPACRSCNSKKHTGPPLKPVQPLLLTMAPPLGNERHGQAS
jgi:5-methylcytosine-specific restriction endonuclease McrA